MLEGVELPFASAQLLLPPSSWSPFGHGGGPSHGGMLDDATMQFAKLHGAATWMFHQQFERDRTISAAALVSV